MRRFCYFPRERDLTGWTQRFREGKADRRAWRWVPLAFFFGAWALYALTAAPGTLFGDPSEYQFIPAIWGIAHPPGYAVYTLLAGVWQRVVAVGSVAFRTNLLAGAAGAWAASRVVLVALDLERGAQPRPWEAAVAALVAGLAVATAPDVWQHSIHANAHIVSVALTATHLWALVRWQRTDDDRWLFALAALVGLGVAHHPITVWGVPAYAVFILVRRPRLPVQPRTLLPFVAAGLLGLTPWLYFPLRSPDAPFGPTDMATWSGFLRHATAQGLRVNLFYFGLADQWDRLRVFWTLVRLQYPWPLLLLMGVGAVVLVRRHRRLALLWGLFLLGHLAFTLNSVQDVMAYLLHPFVALGVPLALGAGAVLRAVRRWRPRWWPRWASALLTLALLALPIGRALHTLPRISLRDWRAADAFVAGLFQRFAGQGAGAALASDWEHLTPYFYHTYVEGRAMPEEDVHPIYVTGAMTWAQSVFTYLPQGPVYLTNYRRDLRDMDFRLRPAGELWQVLEPPALAPVAPQHRLDDVWAAGDVARVQVLGYDLGEQTVMQGGVVPIVLYARVATTQTQILMPYARLGDGDGMEQRWTTDSRRLTPEWLPGEIIAERYEVFVPYGMAPGTYPLRLGYADLTGGEALTFSGGAADLALGALTVAPNASAGRRASVLERSLTNLGNEVALVRGCARAGWRRSCGVWEAPLALRAGQPLHLTLTWRALARPRASYTVFIHLIDDAGRPWMGHDYTPLGGAFPSYLWFPKWLEGQQVIDPYRLEVPADVPPGRYWLEVGMYEMSSVRRVPQLAPDGTMTGDRLILGPVQVTP